MSPPTERMDVFGWAIANMHQMLGHEKAAVALGVDPWPYGRDVPCLICDYERDPTPQRRQAVIAALAPSNERGPQ